MLVYLYMNYFGHRIYQQNSSKIPEKILILESCCLSKNIVFEIHLQRNSFFSVCYRSYTPGYICDCTTLKMFDISSSKSPSRKSIFNHLVGNEDKIISFLYIFSFNLHIYIYREREREILDIRYILEKESRKYILC